MNLYQGTAKKRSYRGSAAVMFSALSLLFLYIATITPVGRIAFYFLCSIFIMGIMLERMVITAVISFVCVLLVGYIIVPDKAGMLPYLFFFGHYGIFKALFDQLGGGRAFVLKLVHFNLGMMLVYFFGGGFLAAQVPFQLPWWALLATGNGIFLVFDVLFSKMAAAYFGGLRNRLVGAGRGW